MEATTSKDKTSASEESLKPTKMLEFDDMLAYVGDFGRYQKFLFIFQAPFCIFLAFVAYGQLFMQLYPEVFWCQDQFECNIGILSPEQKQMLTTPLEVSQYTCELNDFTPDYLEAIAANEEQAREMALVCKNKVRCTFNGTHWYSKPAVLFHEHVWGLKPKGSAGISSGGGGKLPAKCDRENMLTKVSVQPGTNFELSSQKRIFLSRGRTLDHCKKVGWEKRAPGHVATFYSSVVTEGNWWCQAEFWITLSQVVFFIGAIVGGYTIGWIADKYGRIPALVFANVIGAVGGILSTFTTNFYWFSFFRFLTGMAYDNCFVMIHILVLEFCGPTYRTIVANLSIAIFFTLGTAILPWIAEYADNWRTFGLVISAPMFLVVVAIFVVPESARWLLSIGEAKKATDIFRRFAKINRKKVDEQIFVDFENSALRLYGEISKDAPDPSIKEIFKTRRLRRTFLLLVVICSCIALVYDGHNRNILNLANEEWNLFWMFSLASLTEFPADILMLLTLDRFGRRWMSFASLSFSGICSLIAARLLQDSWTATFVLVMISRLWTNVVYNISLQYASELMPTVIRAKGVNVIHKIGYIVSLLSPWIAQTGRHNEVASLLLLEGLAFFAGVLCLFLPETLGEDLPNNLAEAEDFGKNQRFWSCPYFCKPKPPVQERKRSAEAESKSEEGVDMNMRNNLRATSRADIRDGRRFGGPGGDDRSILEWLFS